MRTLILLFCCGAASAQTPRAQSYVAADRLDAILILPTPPAPGSARALADLAEFRDTDTGDHVLRVQLLSDAIAGELQRMGVYAHDLTPRFMEMIGMASILHDVGKVGTDADRAQLGAALVNVIAGPALAGTPLAVDIVAEISPTDLLRMTRSAAKILVHQLAAGRDAGHRLREGLALGRVIVGREIAELAMRGHGQAGHPDQ